MFPFNKKLLHFAMYEYATLQYIYTISDSQGFGVRSEPGVIGWSRSLDFYPAPAPVTLQKM